MAVPITSPTPTPVIGSFQKRQPVYAPIETDGPILEILPGNTADALNERASGAGDSFDSLLCATLKALKSENPATFTSLLQSCTSLTDSGSSRRTRMLTDRKDVNAETNLASDVEAVDDGFGKAIPGKDEADLPEKRGLSINDVVEKRQDEGSTASFAPL